jgi:pimeloyl-ACP methyl ester carboxylesterase
VVHSLGVALVGVLMPVATAALLVSGCGSPGAAAGLRDRLLSASDLPVGWSAVPTSTSAAEVTHTPCLAGPPTKPTGWTYQVVGFVDGTSLPNVGEVLAGGAQVAPTWARLDRALAHCRTAMLQLGGARVEATVRPLAFPRVGRSSSAYAWTFTSAGIRFGFDLVVFRVGSYGGYLSYADLGSPPTSTVTAFVRAAVAKAKSGSTTRVPNAVSITSAPVLTAKTSLGRVAYRTTGSGPPLLLITGYSGTMESWDRRVVDALARHHRVIVFDNAGVGRTQALPAPLTIDAMAGQASALVGALRLGRTDVLGWSMGSMIAQALAVRHPGQVRRLVLCASFPGIGTAVPPSRQRLNAFESGDPKKVMASLFPADRTAARNAYLAAISSYPAAPPAPANTVAAQGRAVDAWWAGTDAAGRKTGTIAVPTLVADGTADELDPVVNSRELARLIPNAKLQLYPGAGHAFLFQDQATFLPLIESFLGGFGETASETEAARAELALRTTGTEDDGLRVWFGGEKRAPADRLRVRSGPALGATQHQGKLAPALGRVEAS